MPDDARAKLQRNGKEGRHLIRREQYYQKKPTTTAITTKTRARLFETVSLRSRRLSNTGSALPKWRTWEHDGGAGAKWKRESAALSLSARASQAFLSRSSTTRALYLLKCLLLVDGESTFKFCVKNDIKLRRERSSSY